MPRKEVGNMTDDSISMILTEAKEVTEAIRTLVCENVAFEDINLPGTSKKSARTNTDPVETQDIALDAIIAMYCKSSQTEEEEVDHFANLPGHKLTQTEKILPDLASWSVYFEIESKNPNISTEENKDSPTRKARAMATKKDPMQEFFTLTF